MGKGKGEMGGGRYYYCLVEGLFDFVDTTTTAFFVEGYSINKRNGVYAISSEGKHNNNNDT